MKKNRLSAIAASNGVAIAKVFKLEKLNLTFTPKKEISKEEEIETVEKAVTQTVQQLDDLKKQAMDKLSKEEIDVFEAHKMMAMDPALKDRIINNINDENMDAPSSVDEATNYFISSFESLDDEYFKARAADIKDVKTRFLANVLGRKIPDLQSIKEEVIIVADDLTPSETSQLNKNYTLGFITNVGGRTSHSAIMARSLEIPAIVGTKCITDIVENGDLVILDAVSGDVIIDPSEEEIKTYKAKIEEIKADKDELRKYKDLKSYSKDQHQVELVANIGSPKDLDGVIENGAEGVGLYRTEFLYMDSDSLPSEEVQFEAYKKVLETLDNKPVVVRTLDIGGDKNLSYMKFPEEMNPFLGYRAIRFCLDQDQIFRVQLRALLRASAFGNLKIMFPMIATLEEFRSAKEILLEEKAKLKAENIQVSDDIEVGIMVEIPSTAVMADVFAKEVDFFSVGTNDLIQYTMACDRMSEKVSYLYQPYNPAILRMVKNVIDAANKENIWVGMCGEMAQDPIAIPILLSIGLHEFSMSASSILQSRRLISELNKEELEKHVDNILNLDTAAKVKEYVENNLQ